MKKRDPRATYVDGIGPDPFGTNQMYKKPLCKCGKLGTRKGHHCAYRVEIMGDPEEKCHCCDECTAKCAEEV